ncbi:MAG: alpha/beta fold hydrolase [Candidatus Dormibacteria bacterium]
MADTETRTGVSGGMGRTAVAAGAGTLTGPGGNPVTMVPTRLGELRVEVCGTGPPAVLWHSLFVDSTTWERVRRPLSAARRLIIIDGPSHGRSAPAARLFTGQECAGAALDVLDHLGVSQPVDWVGNAWGGHVGIFFARAAPERCRSLIMIGTPVHGLTRAERPKLTVLVGIYRLTGPIQPLVTLVSDALLGAQSAARSPEDAQLVGDALRRASRRGMYLAMRSLMLKRPDLTAALRGVTVPTLVVSGDRDPLWTSDQARAAAALPSRGACRVVPGGGHVAPLLEGAVALVEVITGFWADPA